MFVRSRRHDDTIRIASMLELTRSTNTIKKRDQYNRYNQDFKHEKEHYVDDTYDDKHRITEAIQIYHDLETEEKEVNCSECIEFSLKKKF